MAFFRSLIVLFVTKPDILHLICLPPSASWLIVWNSSYRVTSDKLHEWSIEQTAEGYTKLPKYLIVLFLLYQPRE